MDMFTGKSSVVLGNRKDWFKIQPKCSYGTVIRMTIVWVTGRYSSTTLVGDRSASGVATLPT